MLLGKKVDKSKRFDPLAFVIGAGGLEHRFPVDGQPAGQVVRDAFDGVDRVDRGHDAESRR